MPISERMFFTSAGENSCTAALWHFPFEKATAYMVMDYLEGYSLETILSQAGGCLPVDKALALISPLFDALVLIHAKQIYHRDISIQNVRVLKTGTPILIDFGAARHIVGKQSRSLDLVLKQGYSPLEQYSGHGKIGPWTDIYACGALLYLMITGLLPPAATDRFGEETLIAPAMLGVEISTAVNEAIMRALAIKLEERYQTVHAFKAALQGKTSTVSIPLVPIYSQRVKRRKSHRKFVTLIILSTLFLLMMPKGLFFDSADETILLKSLFMQIDTQLARENFTKPKGNNAYETYQQILEIAPDNAVAKTGLFNVAEYYFNEAMKAKAADKWEDSLKMIEQGLQVMPSHADLLTLRQNVKTHIAV
ncbi:protein kinase, partial [Candidatus Marithioploca araucensis]|nr:protein kinase [Candidatus Marithioploca araucensis]